MTLINAKLSENPLYSGVIDQDASELLNVDPIEIREKIRAGLLPANISFEIAPCRFEMYLSIADIIHVALLKRQDEAEFTQQCISKVLDSVFEIFLENVDDECFSDLKKSFRKKCLDLCYLTSLRQFTVAKNVLECAIDNFILILEGDQLLSCEDDG